MPSTRARALALVALLSVSCRQSARSPAQPSLPPPSATRSVFAELLQLQGVEHIAYYPDMLFENHPEWSPMRHTFAIKPDAPKPH